MTDTKIVELGFNPESRSPPSHRSVRPRISFSSNLYFKFAFAAAGVDCRRLFYARISENHNYILSSLLNLFDIKISYKDILTQLVFFEPEPRRWGHKISSDHLRGMQGIVVLFDMDEGSFPTDMLNYLRYVYRRRDITYPNVEERPKLSFVGSYTDSPHKFWFEEEGFQQTMAMFPNAEVCYTPVKKSWLSDRRTFQQFEEFFFINLFTQTYESLKEPVVGDEMRPQILWRDQLTQQELHSAYPSFSGQPTIGDISGSRFRCVAHGGLIQTDDESVKCLECGGVYCSNCYKMYKSFLTEDTCFGSLLSGQHIFRPDREL